MDAVYLYADEAHLNAVGVNLNADEAFLYINSLYQYMERVYLCANEGRWNWDYWD